MANEGMFTHPRHRPLYCGIADAYVAMNHFQQGVVRNGRVPIPQPAEPARRIYGEKYGPTPHQVYT